MSDMVETLRKARERVQRAWGQGKDSGYPGRPDCVLTALYKSTGTFDIRIRGERVIARVIGLARYHRNLVIEWNDAPGRTQADALALYDRAIALAEQEAA